MRTSFKNTEDELREIIREEKSQDRLAMVSLVISVLALLVAVVALLISEL